MSIPYQEPLAVASRWLATAKIELIKLASDIVELFRSTRLQWREDPRFRAQVIREVLRVLGTGIPKGPRVTVLVIIEALADLILIASGVLRQRDTASPLFSNN